MDAGGRRLALLIGCSRYEHLPALPGPQHDVAAIRTVLEQQGDFACEVIADFQYTEIKKRISRFIRELQPADTGLLFYSGHGVTGVGTRKIYLCTYETSPDEPNVAGFSDDEVQEFIRPSKASALVVIIDSCYSGAFADIKGDGPGGIRHEFSSGGRGTIILAATDRRSTVPAQTKGGSALSPFTGLVIEGLRGAADKDQPYVTAQGLATFLDKATKEQPELGLNPTWGGGGFNGPAIRIVRNPDVDLGNFPDAIRNALISPDIYARMGAYFHIGQHARFDSRLADPARRLLDRYLVREFGRVPGASDTIRSVLGWLDDAGRLAAQEERLRIADASLAASQAELRAALDTVRLDADRTGEQRQTYERALAASKDDAVQAEAARDEATQALARAEGRLLDIQAEVAETRSALSEAARLRREAEAERDRLRVALAEAEGRVQAIAPELDRTKAAAADAQRRLQQAEAARGRIEAGLAQATRDLQEAEKDRDETRARLASATKRLQMLDQAAPEKEPAGLPPPAPSKWRTRILVGIAGVAAVLALLLYRAEVQTTRLQRDLVSATGQISAVEMAKQSAVEGWTKAAAALKTAEVGKKAAETDRDNAVKALEDYKARNPATTPPFVPPKQTDARPTGIPAPPDVPAASEPISAAGLNCDRQPSGTLGEFICRNKDMWRDHLSLTIPYRAYWQSSGRQASVERDMNYFLEDVFADCLRAAQPDPKGCIRKQYREERNRYLQQLSGAAAQDAQLTPEQAVRIQTLLLAKGYNIGSADGNLGPNTRDAITDWQEKMKLPQTGLVSAATIPLLEKAP